MNQKVLVLLTDSFPFGLGETFLEVELPFLAREFSSVHIIPDFIPEDSFARVVPENCIIEQFFASRTPTGTVPEAMLQRWLNIRIMMNEIGFDLRSLFWYLGRFKTMRTQISASIFESGILGSWLKINISTPFLLYSYWFSQPAMACAILKQQNLVKKWISGVHGYDLFDERHPMGKQVFRNFKLSNCDKVFTTCNSSKKYLKQRSNAKFHDKISTRYLGVNIPNKTVHSDSEIVFSIASCSNLVPLKRVQLIVEILKKIEFPIKWMHIGDGPMMQTIKDIACELPSNVTCQFKGNVSNKDIAGFYLKENVDLFLHLSETEGGAPVAIMDALSCGIPILACKAGGVTEMFAPNMGQLLPVEFKIGEAVSFINDVRNKTISFSNKRIQEICRNNYSAENNYSKIAKKLSQ